MSRVLSFSRAENRVTFNRVDSFEPESRNPLKQVLDLGRAIDDRLLVTLAGGYLEPTIRSQVLNFEKRPEEYPDLSRSHTRFLRSGFGLFGFGWRSIGKEFTSVYDLLELMAKLECSEGKSAICGDPGVLGALANADLDRVKTSQVERLAVVAAILFSSSTRSSGFRFWLRGSQDEKAAAMLTKALSGLEEWVEPTDDDSFFDQEPAAFLLRQIRQRASQSSPS